MVILTLDTVLSSRTSIAPWFGTAYVGYSPRNMIVTMVMVLQMADDSFKTDYKRYKIQWIRSITVNISNRTVK